jgi:tetratricopeptide (TPR) repeat protein
VQLFVHRARSVAPHFRLTESNVDDVVALCRRLDGLPLAIELCASRIRLLAPRALLNRVDTALDIPSTDRLVPLRQRTLRNTVAWSYELLTPSQQRFFRRLAVFAGGADIEAVGAIASAGGEPISGSTKRVDPLDAVAELVDANLADVTEGLDGEPRVILLETIRAFAWDKLRATDESEAACAAHAAHYAERGERLLAMRESRHVAALALAETELDNFREALDWAAPPPDRPASGAGHLETALRLCSAVSWVWDLGGYVTEGRQWLERILGRAAGAASPQLAALHLDLANLLLHQGDIPRTLEVARQGLTMARSVGDEAAAVYALAVLGRAHLQAGDLEAARVTLRESLEVRRQLGDRAGVARTLGHLAGIEESLGHFDAAERLLDESLGILEDIGDRHGFAVQGQNLANLLALAGRPHEARELAQGLVDRVVGLRNPNLTMAFANTYMNILLRLGDPVRAAELFGAEEAMHERLAIPNPFHDEELEEALVLVDGALTPEDWDRHRRRGNDLRVEDVLTQLGS